MSLFGSVLVFDTGGGGTSVSVSFLFLKFDMQKITTDC